MKKYPPKTIDRTFIYLRILDGLEKSGEQFVSSQKLSEITGLTDVQIRKDISNFGKVGKPRVGYPIKDLKRTFEDIIKYNILNIVLFGVGNLGSALIKYSGFKKDKIRIVAAFDSDKAKIGKITNGIKIYALSDAPRIIKKTKSEIGIIAVPTQFSQATADIMVKSGLKGIINFSPSTIKVPDNVSVKYIDLSIEFLSLSCELK